MMTHNMTLSQQKKERLSHSAKQVFAKISGEVNAKSMEILSNKGNLAKVFEGFQGFPEETEGGYLVRLSGVEGSIQSPGYGDTFSMELYRLVRGKEMQYTLEVQELMEKEGVVKVKVEMDDEVEVEVEFGKKYVGFNDWLTWSDAESSCA